MCWLGLISCANGVLKSIVSPGASPNFINEPARVTFPPVVMLGAVTLVGILCVPVILLNVISPVILVILLGLTTLMFPVCILDPSKKVSWPPVVIFKLVKPPAIELVSILVVPFSKSIKKSSPTLKLPLWSTVW